MTIRRDGTAHVFHGTETGPTSVILVGVHGDERCGVEAADKILPDLKIEAGTVYIILANPRAVEEDVRFTEQNLNRMFKPVEELTDTEKQSYEFNRAEFLKPYLDQADYLLDVHASTVPESPLFIICEDIAKDIVKYLPAEKVVYGFDAVQPGGTDYYVNSIGNIGICVECGYLGDPDTGALAEDSIKNFLAAVGHINLPVFEMTKSVIEVYTMYITETDSFVRWKEFANFETVEAGQLIGIDGSEKVFCKEKSQILFAHNCDKVGQEAFLLARKVQ